MLRVAIDTGPLHGPRTGVGNAVAWYLDALRTANAVDVQPYVTSMRARPEPGERRLPLPAAAALRLWARSSRPPLDRFLGQPDLVHGTNYVVPPTSVPRLVSVYDCWFLDHPDQAHPDVALASAVLVRSLREGATALVSSAATAERLQRHVDTDRIEVVYLGPPVDDAGADAAPDAAVVDRLEGRRFVVAVGTQERRKNYPHLVRSFSMLCEQVPDVDLVIAGGAGDDAAVLGTAVRRLPAAQQDRVVLAGRVSAATKRWLLDHAAVLSYVSLDEGFGFPILEAQQAGVPVVCGTAGSSPEVGGAGVRCVAPDDEAGLVDALGQLLTDDSERAAMIEAGRQNLDRFSWARCVEQTVELYRRVAHS